MPRGDHNRKMSAEQWERVVAEYLAPLPDGTYVGCPTLARKYGVAPNAIDYHLRRSGVSKRCPKESHANGKQCKPITRLPPEGQQPPLCKCGCGTHVKWSRSKNRWLKYVRGHYRPKRAYHRPEWLRREYEQKGRSATDIAAEFDVSVQTIHKALVRAGIPERPHGESLRLSGKVKGENNPAWNGGSSPERQRLYKQGHWREFSQSIYARDGFQCRRCGRPKGRPKSLHAHHLKPWANNPALRFDPDNCVTLCHRCHIWVHSSANVGREFLD